MKRPRAGGSRLLASWLVVLSALACAGKPALTHSVPEQSQRRLVLPQRIAWLSSERTTEALPSAIELGGQASGRVLVYLEFPELELELGRKLLRAELWLSLPARTASAIDVELSRAEAAGNELVRWSEQPQARYPRVAAKLGGGGVGSRQRLDVSELVRAPSKPGEPLRVLLRAEPHGLEPILLETGAFGGNAPRLELYWE